MRVWFLSRAHVLDFLLAAAASGACLSVFEQ
jgi:hypothetical protein